MKSRIALFGIGLTLLLSPVRLAVADPFTYTTIDFPAATASVAAGINNPGQIVGGYLLADESGTAFCSPGVFSARSMTRLQPQVRRPWGLTIPVRLSVPTI